MLLAVGLIVTVSTTSIDCDFEWHQENYTQPRDKFYRCDLNSVKIFVDNNDLDDSAEESDETTIAGVTTESSDVEIEDTKGDVDSEYDKVTMVQIYHPLVLSEIPDSLFKVFDNMEYLVIYHTGLNEINQEDFKDANNLKYLRIHSNDVEELKENTFSEAENLEYINLAYNAIEVVHRHAFTGPSDLKEVHLNNNKISMIHYQAFKNLNNLIIINFKNNLCIKERYEKYVNYIDLKLVETELQKRKCNKNYVAQYGGKGGVGIVRGTKALFLFSSLILFGLF